MSTRSIFASLALALAISGVGAACSSQDGNAGVGGKQEQNATSNSDAGSPSTAQDAESTEHVAASLDEIKTKYFEGKDPLPENKRVMCPFLRLMESSGAFAKDAAELANRLTAKIEVPVKKLVDTAFGFGCEGGCDQVAALVSGAQHAQIPDHTENNVDITNLHRAKPISHGCGLTFSSGGSEVDEARRGETLASLKAIADAKPGDQKGRLEYKDLYAVKIDTCNKEKVVITRPEQVEVDLIYAYLGGPDRGFVEYSDVDLFFHTKLPKTKPDRKSVV